MCVTCLLLVQQNPASEALCEVLGWSRFRFVFGRKFAAQLLNQVLLLIMKNMNVQIV